MTHIDGATESRKRVRSHDASFQPSPKRLFPLAGSTRAADSDDFIHLDGFEIAALCGAGDARSRVEALEVEVRGLKEQLRDQQRLVGVLVNQLDSRSAVPALGNSSPEAIDATPALPCTQLAHKLPAIDQSSPLTAAEQLVHWFEVAALVEDGGNLKQFSPLRLWTIAARKATAEAAGRSTSDKYCGFNKYCMLYLYIVEVLAAPPSSILQIRSQLLAEAQQHYHKQPVVGTYYRCACAAFAARTARKAA